MPESLEPETEPILAQQTALLGTALKEVSERDPFGTPSPQTASVFAEWLEIAGASSHRPGLFADVRENYVATDHSNKDLWDIFELLGNYLEIEEEEWDDEEPAERTFIGLPMLGTQTTPPSSEG